MVRRREGNSALIAAQEEREGSTAVALIDDHEIVAHALSAALDKAPSLRFIGYMATVDEFLSQRLGATVVVLDLRLGDGSSPRRNVEKLVEAGHAVVVFTSGESPYLVRAVAGTPIFAVVGKSRPLGELIHVLEEAAAGHAVMSTEWASAIDTDAKIDAARLSPKERDVLSLFASGLKAQAVASAVGIAESTVEDYVRRIRAKYARIGRPADTKVDLYKRAVEDGFVPSPSDRK